MVYDINDWGGDKFVFMMNGLDEWVVKCVDSGEKIQVNKILVLWNYFQRCVCSSASKMFISLIR